LETCLSPNNGIRICCLNMRRSRTKNALFETWITRNNVNGVSSFNFSYIIPVMAHLSSQRTPNIQIKYLMFYWSIHRLFVLKRGCKCVSLQIMIFVNVCSTRSIVELNTCFDTWITRNDVNGVSLFKLSYLITRMAYLCSQRTPKVQINCLKFDWSIYRLFALNRVWKLVSLKIMIFVYICSTWGIAELKTRFEMWITKKT
jgi:hypothetical protein